MRFETGMTIEIFPDTDVSAYLRMIKENGFNAKVYRDRIEILERCWYPVDKMKLARTLRQARKGQKMTRDVVAEKIGVNPCSVRDWERGKRVPNRYNLTNYCNLVGLVYEEVLKNAVENK